MTSKNTAKFIEMVFICVIVDIGTWPMVAQTCCSVGE
jgi:hypothetical protein